MTEREIITLGISIIALCLSIINSITNLRSNKRNRKIQERNDRIEVDSLLDKALDCLHGENGYFKTKEKGKLYEAKTAILRAKEIDKTYSRVVEYEGMCLEIEGITKKAIGKYKEAIKLKPLRWQTYNLLGFLHEEEEAIQYFEKAIKSNPEKAGVPLFNSGRKYIKMNRLDDAKNALLKSLEYLPKYEFTHYELGNLYIKEGSVNQARLSLEKAISINPRYIDAMALLGSLIAQNIDLKEGISWLEHASKIDPTDGHPFAMMGALYADINEPENALKYFEKAAEINPEYKLSTDVLNELTKKMVELKNAQNKG